MVWGSNSLETSHFAVLKDLSFKITCGENCPCIYLSIPYQLLNNTQEGLALSVLFMCCALKQWFTMTASNISRSLMLYNIHSNTDPSITCNGISIMC